jgi:hypothetical protein
MTQGLRNRRERRPGESPAESTAQVAVEHYVEIAADRARVWHALTEPASVVIWDVGIIAPLDAPPDYPQPGQVVRWRYRLLGFPTTLVDRPQEVVPQVRLRTLIDLAFLRIDETYTLEPSHGRPEGTRLTAQLYLSNTLPLLSGAFDRHLGRGLASSTICESLTAIRDFCEKNRRNA